MRCQKRLTSYGFNFVAYSFHEDVAERYYKIQLMITQFIVLRFQATCTIGTQQKDVRLIVLRP